MSKSKLQIVEELRYTWDLLQPEEQEQAEQFILSVRKEEAAEHFYPYVQLMAPLMLPEGFIDGRHIKLMCEELESLERSTAKSTALRKPSAPSVDLSKEKPLLGRRVQFLLPPGSMKSKLLNLFVTWCFGRHPKWNILHIGHSTQFAEDNFGRQIRDLMNTPEYSSIFSETRIKKDVKAAGRWETTQGGKYFAGGVGVHIAGRRGTIVVCDDVVSEQTAYSDLERPKINAWYVPGLRTRLLPGGSEIIVNTKWHLDDMSGYLLKVDEESRNPWKVFTIPAILTKEAADLLNSVKWKLGENLREGGSFWPEFWPLDALEEKRKDKGMSEAKWNALYQQSPIPEEGNIIKENAFRMWTQNEPPPVDYLLVSVDTAFSTRESADFSAYSIWGVFKEPEEDLLGREYLVNSMILLDCEQGRWEFPQLASKIMEINGQYEPDVFVIEKKASGQSLIQEMRRRGVPIAEYIPDKDKLSRAHACTPFLEAGRVWIPGDRLDEETVKPKAFAQELVTEATQFPFGSHDDLTDTLTQAILWMRDSFNISNPDYTDEYEEDEDGPRYQPRLSYWNLVNPRA